MCGERDWQDLWDLKDELGQGSRYQSAKLQEPDTIDRLASLPDSDAAAVPLEGFDPLIARLANIEDWLARLVFVTAHADPTGAPSALRPEMPHVARRREIKAAKRNAFEMRLIPGGVDG